MSNSRWYTHPLFIFILALLASLTSLYLYIRWSLIASDYFGGFAKSQGVYEEQLFKYSTWSIILTISFLIAIFVFGLLIIFIYYNRANQLYRLQQNFIDNFTHELKTPISSIRLFLETSRKYDLEKEKRDTYIGYMLTDIERLNDSVNNILKVSRLESRIHEYQKTRENLTLFLENLIAKHQHSFGKLQIDLKDHTSHPIFFEFNESLLEMVFLNLFSNALKYNDSALPHLQVDIFRSPGQFRVELTDNGIGIALKDRRRIFDKFYQVNANDSTAAKGTGIGLYLVKNIVRMHNGRIRIKFSQPNIGTTFCINFPTASFPFARLMP